MAERYKVVRRWIKYKGKIYQKGELLPEEFTHHDRFRNIYPSRVELITVEDEPEVKKATGVKVVKGTKPAAKAKALSSPTTGTPTEE